MLSTVTNAAGIYILEPIDENYTTGDSDINVGGALVYATKGKPFEPMRVYSGTKSLINQFGTPLPKKSEGMEGLRQVYDAAQECSYVQTIRVVASDYRFPSISFTQVNSTDAGEWTADTEYVQGDLVDVDGTVYVCGEPHTAADDNKPGTDDGTAYWVEYSTGVTTATHRYNEDIEVGDGSWLVIYPVDGDASTNRTVIIEDIDAENQRFTITINDVDEDGEEYELESHEVMVGEDDKDDMGLSAYAETVFERDSDVFRVLLADGITWDDIYESLMAVRSTSLVTVAFPFVGGTGGSYPDTDDWLTGCELLKNERMDLNLLFAAGITDYAVLMEMADVADFRHISFFYDIPGSLKSSAAIEWDQDLNITSRHARAYYSPYSAYDIFRGGQTVWGVSGAAAAAVVRGNSIQNVKSTWGVHYSPAGEKRGYLDRSSLTALFPDDVIDRDDFYDARINPVVTMAAGGCNIDDDLTKHNESNYLRFGWVNQILDYIDHQFFEAASQVKFEPDGITRENLTSLMTEILEDLVTSEALVTPRDTAKDGTSPYVLTITQEEIDKWSVQWDVCPTGCARRIVGQPVVIG